MSPVLFCVYIDDLLLALSKSGVGCYIGSNFVGALAYADDIVLIAPTATALRKLLAICGEYASEYCISFNAAKSKCLVVLPRSRRDLRSHLNNCVFTVNKQPIEFVESFKHLGHVITSNFEDDSDISNRRNDFIGQVNNMLCYFRKLTSFVKYSLFRSYCTSYYGCELWSLLTKNIEDMCVSWRKSIRSVWSLPQCTHCYILPLVCHCLPIFDEICRRSLNFARACVSHESALVRRIASYGINFARSESLIGQNVLFCIDRYKCSISDILYGSVNRIIYSQYYNTLDDGELHNADFLSELIDVRDNRHEFSDNLSLSYDELNDIILYVCTC